MGRAFTRAWQRVADAPSTPLGRWPTPVDDSECLAGPVLIKRDDLSGFGRGGTKTRKIEGLLGQLKARGHDELITFAGNITNVAFDLVEALPAHGIRPTILVVDDPPMAPDRREGHFAGVTEHVQLLGASRVRAATAAAEAWRRSRSRGGRPLLVLPGSCHPAAITGNARAMIELADQLDAVGRELPRTVFVSAATGNTIAGFLIGAAILRAAGYPPIRVVGVQVYPGPMTVQVRALVWWTSRWLKTGRLPLGEFQIVRTEMGKAFGAYPAELVARCEQVADVNGIAIDPIFGGKTWTAMEDMMRAGRVEGPVLYWHCGYTPEWRDLQLGGTS